MFKRKMPVMRFRCAGEYEPVTAEDFFSGLKMYRFVDSETGFAKQMGFVNPDEPFSRDDKMYQSEAPFYENWCIGAFRIDTITIPSDTVKRLVTEKLKTEKEITGKKFISRDRRKEVTEQVKITLMQRAIPKSKVFPFFFDLHTGEGYLFSTSASVFDNFQDLFSRAIGCEVDAASPAQILPDNTLLTFMWWQSESNSARIHEYAGGTVETVFGNQVRVVSATNKVTTSGDSEESRIAVSKGGMVDNAEIEFSYSTKDRLTTRVCRVNSEGCFDSFSFLKEELFETDDFGHLLILREVRRFFGIMDSWARICAEAQDSNLALTPEIQEKWGRGDFCSRSFEDI